MPVNSPSSCSPKEFLLPLFHWGPLAWGFYVILAVCFGFMMHVRRRERQRFSEACRPLLGDKVDGFWGKVIDVVAIFAVVCATATKSEEQARPYP